jgi:hypothetical protein
VPYKPVAHQDAIVWSPDVLIEPTRVL